MEQYIHTLIPVDSNFAPAPTQVADFFDALVSQCKFVPSPDRQHSLPGLALAKPSGKLRWGINQFTGEKFSVPGWDRLNLERFEDIPVSIGGSAHYTVMQSGQWAVKDRPLVLFTTDGVPYEKDNICIVRCELRPEAVSTSAWDVEAGPNRFNLPQFGTVCASEIRNGVFPNPWTGESIQVTDAGCARFWVEFEFGRFIYPRITNSLEVLNPEILRIAEQCFGMKFVQGCRFW